MWFNNLFKRSKKKIQLYADKYLVDEFVKAIEERAVKRRIIRDYFTDRIKEVYGECWTMDDFMPSKELIDRKYLYGKDCMGDKQFMIYIGIMEKYFDKLKQEQNAETGI